ncbi:hypothetical protein PM082_024548 [Marasmius tenuissimus]|nr:hypothetical protein PM082_024548 [Marasmius tenuissimus]
MVAKPSTAQSERREPQLWGDCDTSDGQGSRRLSNPLSVLRAQIDVVTFRASSTLSFCWTTTLRKHDRLENLRTSSLGFSPHAETVPTGIWLDVDPCLGT